MSIQRIARRESAVDACARTLREAILEGELAPGEKLLPERELAERLGVNRVTIRSALGRLRAGRLLEVRQGSGHRVQDYRRVGGPELLPTLLSLGASPKQLRSIAGDLLLVRRMLLRGAIERLISECQGGAKRGSVTRIRRAVRALAIEKDNDRKAQLERFVVDTVLDEAGSAVLSLALNPFMAVLEHIPHLADALAEDPGGSLPAWDQLIEGLGEVSEDLGPDPEREEQEARRLADRVAGELARHDEVVLSRLPRR